MMKDSTYSLFFLFLKKSQIHHSSKNNKLYKNNDGQNELVGCHPRRQRHRNRVKHNALKQILRFTTGCSKEKVLRLINNRTNTFCLIFKISFVSDSRDISLDFDISFLTIGQILTELRELEDQNAVNHETSELFHFGCYIGIHKRVDSCFHMLN